MFRQEGAATMSRACFFPLFVFLVFLFSLFQIYPHVVPSAPLPPLYIVLWMNTGEGRIFLSVSLVMNVLLLGLEDGWESYNWICRLASVVVGQWEREGKGGSRVSVDAGSVSFCVCVFSSCWIQSSVSEFLSLSIRLSTCVGCCCCCLYDVDNGVGWSRVEMKSCFLSLLLALTFCSEVFFVLLSRACLSWGLNC